MLKRTVYILLLLSAFTGLSAPALSQQASPALASFDFTIVGVGIGVSPEYQAVPKGISSQVLTTLNVGPVDVAEIAKQLPKDYTVRADLSGPAFPSPIHLQTAPGKPFDLPTLPILGKYTLSNVRLCDGAGRTILGAVPQAVAIESVPDPLVVSVTTHQLTQQELQDLGVVTDASNYTAYEFSTAIATSSGQVPISMPVLIPNTQTVVNPEDIPQPGQIGVVPPAVQTLPPGVPETVVPQNLTITPFMMEVQDQDPAVQQQLPPIPGVVVIPGNIGFLNQYFSALVMVTNGAPGQSSLVIKDVKAVIKFPPGDDLVPGTDALPGDDPIRMAKGANGYFPREMTVYNAGPDGVQNTADDVSQLYPAETGQADFTIEGRKEGTHKIDFDITATLEGLPVGPVTLKGKASGAVLVRNPDFTLTFGHPKTVRSGEEYDLFITITNTSQAMANQVSLHLDPRALSGAVFVAGESPDKTVDTIEPGSSATVRFRLQSQRTGAVTATAFEAEDVKGRFILRSGVGENSIPLSPDSLILPYTGSLPQDLTDAVVGLLGQAWSVATAPSAALPPDVLPISKQIVVNRAYDLSEAGLRVLIGEDTVKAVEALSFDVLGSDTADTAFDSLRRKSTQGLNANAAMAAVFAPEAEASGALAFQADFADLATYRPGHVSVVTSEAPVRVMVTDEGNSRTGGLSAGEFFREIPYGDQIAFSSECTGTSSGFTVQSSECVNAATAKSTLTLITKIESASYRVDVRADADAGFDLGIVVPDGSATLTQVRFPGVSLTAGGRAWVELLPNTNASYILNIDENNDGTIDSTIAGSVLAIPDRGPRVVAATQLVPGFGPGGDKHGRNVAVLFSERVTKETAGDIANYAVEENAVKAAVLQPSGRMAFLLLRDGIGPFYGSVDSATGDFLGRAVTVSGLYDTAGNSMEASATLPVRITAQGPAAVVDGTVRKANGEPVANATVKLMQLIWWKDPLTGVEEPRYAIFTEKTADGNGSYHFDYVLKNEDPGGPFMIEVTDPATNEVGQVTTSVAFHGQRMNLDIFMKARGSLSGTVKNETGAAVAGAAVQVTTLNDGRIFSTTTDAAGAYAFANLSVGAFNLKVVHQATLSQATTMGTLPDDGSSVTQDIIIYRISDIPQGSVTGKVFASDGTTPKDGAIVVISAPNYTNWTRSAADGSFSFSGVFAGAVTVLARDDVTGERTEVRGTVADNSTSVFNIIMKGTGMVTGQVQRGDGLSVDGLYVVASAIQPGQQLKWVVRTDADGYFVFDVLPVAEIRIEVLDPRDFNRTVATGTVTLLTAGEIQNIFLFVPNTALATATIQGTVYRRDGSVWPNAAIRLVMDSYHYYPYKADSQGKYVMPDLALRTYQLVVISGSTVCNATATLWYGSQVKTVDLVPAGMGTITGTIYDDAERTIPTGADVVVYSTKPNAMGLLVYDTNFPTVIKSDPQTGRYTVNGVYAGSFTVSSSNIFRPVKVSAGGAITADNQTVTVDLSLKGSPPPPDGGGGTQPPVNTMGSASGIVYQPDGTTPAGEGVKVKVTYGGADVIVTTGPDGAFQFGQVIPAGSYCLIAQDDVTTLEGRSCVSVPTGQNVATTIRLLGRGSMTVRILTAAGDPVPGASVAVNGSGFPNDSASGTVTNQDGTIVFTNLSEGSYAVAAKDTLHGLGGGAQGNIPADNASVDVEVRLAASGTVTGRFLKADGVTPIPGGQVKLLRSGQVIAYSATSSDPADLGTFRMEYVQLGDFTLEGYDPTTARTGKGGGRLLSNAETVTADVIVTPRGTVSGYVLNYGGTAPVPDAQVTISVSGVAGYNYTTTTGPDGGFLFAGVPAGKYTATATDPTNGLRGTAMGTLTYEGETCQATVRIAPTGSIEGRVLMPDGTTPALSAFVSFQDGSNRVQVDQATGGFQYTNLAAGRTYSLVATELNTHRAGKATVAITADNEIAGTEIVLRGVGNVEGTVFDTDGTTPLPDAKVTIQAKGYTTASYTDYTDANGRYGFVDVPVGTFTLSVTHPQRVTAASASGSVGSEAETVAMNMTIGPVASVTGTVLMADAATPARGGGVKFTGCGRTFNGVIDTDGRFLFQSLPVPCSFTLYMEDSQGIGIGYASGTLSVNGEVMDVGTIVLDDQAIAVTEVTPVNGSLDVPVTASVHIAFSEEAKPGTITSSTIYLKKGSTTVPGALVLDSDGSGATFVPLQPLAGMTLYTLYVTTGVTDLVGRGLAATFTSTFSTVDNTPPSVTGVSPLANAVEVPQNAVVRVTFSETVDPAFVAEIALKNGDAAVDAQLDLVQGNTVAILTPRSPLATNTLYTVSVAGVRDLVGNVMGAPFTSFFSTIDIIAPAIQALTIPANADLIKGNTVSVTAASADTDIAFVDFFVDGQFAFTDPASPFAFDYYLASEGTHTIKAVAQDKAGNRNPNAPWAQELAITVQTNLPPQVAIDSPADNTQVSTGQSVVIHVQATDDLSLSEYTLTASGAVVSTQKKTCSGKSCGGNFSITVPQNAAPGSTILVTASARDSLGVGSSTASITLTVRDGTAPVVASITSPGTSVKYKPGETGTATVKATDNIGVASITCTASGAATGSQTFTVDPTALSTTREFAFQVSATAAPYQSMTVSCTAKDAALNTSSAVTLSMQTADVVPPAVASSSIPDSATNIQARPVLSLTFSEPVAAATVNEGSVALYLDNGSGLTVPGTVTLSANRKVVTFTPAEDLVRATAYRFVIASTVADDAGNVLEGDYVLRFTTDGTPPTVASATMQSGATNVQARPSISITFSEAVAAATITNNSVFLSLDDGSGVNVPGTVTLSANRTAITYTPNQNLAKATLYRFTVTTAVADDIGNGLAGDYVLSFTTDSTPPTLTGASIPDNSVDIPVSVTLTASFDEALAAASVTAETVSLIVSGGTGSVVPGSVAISKDHRIITFTPAAELTKGRTYQFTISAAVTDEIGNGLASPVVLHFTTVLPDTTAPAIAAITPADGAQGVSVGAAVSVRFNEPINPDTITKDRLIVSAATTSSPAPGAITFSQDNMTATIRPLAQLDFNTDYVVTVKAGIQDEVGNATAGDAVSAFRTGGFSITSPRDKTAVIQGRTITITASADAGQGIQSVKFSVDNGLIGTKTAAPYSIPFTVPAASEKVQHVITAEGTTAGSSIQAEGVVVIALIADQDEDGDGLTNAQEVDAGTDPFTPDAYADPDNDGLTNIEEISLGTDPNNADTDNDGLTDFEEVREYFTNPLESDTDGDGLKDGEEVGTYLSDPNNADTDGDGLSDGWEVKYSYNPTLPDSDGNGIADGEEDPDADGLRNKWEYCIGLNPRSSRTDGSNLDGNRDSDRDGWTNSYEANTSHTSPCLADGDGDGVIDPDEVNILNTDPNNRDDLYGSDLVLSGEKTIRIEGKAYFNSLTVAGYSNITVLSASTSQVSGAEIEVLGALSIDSTSKIDVSSRGYLGGWQNGNNSNAGRTYGNTGSGGSTYYNGGSYGGSGGIYNGGSVNGVYGDITKPTDPGSGGGGHYYNYQAGGNGGGVVHIIAGSLAVDGSILSEGGSLTPSYVAGGGSGGSIWLEVGTLSGTGTISVKGGTVTNGYGGAGGGGRIAIYYTDKNGFTGTVAANGGNSTTGRRGGAGTVYWQSAAQSYGETIIDNQGVKDVSTSLAGGTYGEITIINSTVIAGGDITADMLSLKNGSILMSPYPTVTQVGQLSLSANSLSIDSTSKIDVSGRGYLGGWQNGNNSNAGRTYGNTGSGGSTYYNGGSYGGSGGIYNGGSVNGVYGDITKPTDPGSGGGGHYYNYQAGGNGGGVVHIIAGSLAVDGSILSEGGSLTPSYVAGGGSGGSIWLEVGTLSGTGTISVKGGTVTNGYGGAGGGGRIAIYYTDKSGFTGTIAANGGSSNTTGRNGGAGTVYFKSGTSIHGELTVDNAGADSNEASTPFNSVGSGLVMELTANSLTNSGAAWKPGILKGLKLKPDADQDQLFTIIDNDATTLYIDPTEGDLRQAAAVGSTYTGVYTFDQAVIKGNAKVFSADLLMMSNELVIEGAVLTMNNNEIRADKITLRNNGVITHRSATTTTASRVTVQAKTELMIDATSRINVTGRGYLGGWQNGNNSNAGRTYGNTTSGGSTYYNGGSYGGSGGIYSGGSVNGVYGDITKPADPGSGGGGYIYNYQAAGNGGGVVHIIAGSLAVDGSILAEGGSLSPSYVAGGGSGGSIWLEVETLSGTGTISAKGGTVTNGYGGAGGGGRIAIYYTDKSGFTGTIAANGGSSSAAQHGSAGTLYWQSTSQPYGNIVIDNQGAKDVPTALPDGTYGDITVINSNMTAENVTANIVSFDNSSVVLKSQITADTVSLNNGSILMSVYPSVTGVGKLSISATSLLVDSTSRIDVSGRGYLGGWQNGNNSNSGRTCGNTTTGGSTYYNGGSYGGSAAIYNSGSVNRVYGDFTKPADPGSGGGGYVYNYQRGGNGGGIVHITADSMTIDGSILAEGENVPSTYAAGGGSGGSIWLEVGTLSGAGKISAKGGSVAYGNGGAGGGGRVAIYYDILSLSTANISAKGGAGNISSTSAGAGTMYLKGRTDAYGHLIIDNKDMESNEASSPLTALGSGVVTELTATSMTNSSASWMPGGLIGLSFKPNTNQDRVYTIIDNDADTLFVDTSQGDLTLATQPGFTYTGITAVDKMTVTGRAKVYANDPLIVTSDLVVDNAVLDTGNKEITADNVSLQNSGLLTHLPVTAATSTYRVLLNATTLLTIDSTSKIDVSGRGYLGGWQAGNSSSTGRTDGNTTTGGSTYYNGGSYGGLGGIYSSGSVNAVYGSELEPTEPGSGGGGYIYNYQRGGNGGGVAHIMAGSVTVDGKILADGISVPSSYAAGGGSGGSIWMEVGTLSGTGMISAKGGSAMWGNGGAGGGGRVAVYYSVLELPTTSISAIGGISGDGVTSKNGRSGTVHYQIK